MLNAPCALFLVFGLAAVTFGAAEPKRVVVRESAGPMRVDGDLSDPGWRGAAALPQLVYQGSDRPYRLKTNVLLAYDRSNLYVAVTVWHPGADKLKYGAQKAKDTYAGAPLVEMWFGTGVATGTPPANLRHVAVNAAGTRFDAMLFGGPNAWDGRWTAAGKVHADHWTLEAAIPLVELGLDAPPVGRPLSANFGVYETALASWTGGWAEPEEQGLVFFENDGRYTPPAPPPRAEPVTPPRTFHVDPAGDDGDDGIKTPFKTIRRAVAAAAAGDTIRVHRGVYHERIVVNHGGLPGRPLTIQGDPGATIHGGDVVKDWEHVGNGLYKKSGLACEPIHMTWDEYFVMFTGRDMKTAAKYLFGDAKGSDWDGIEVAFTSQGNTAWVRARNGEDPNKHTVTVAPLMTCGGATVSVVDADHVIVRGFQIEGGDTGVYLKRASDCTIERNAIRHGKNGVLIHYGSHRDKVLDNYVTLGIHGEMNKLRATPLVAEHIVMMIKGDGRFDHEAVKLEYAGHDHEIAYNMIYQHWDGMKAYSIRGFYDMEDVEIVSQANGRNIRWHHNIICDTWDWAIEPMGGEVNAEYHHNLIYGSPGSRIKRIGTGPCYWYKNCYAFPYRGLPEMERNIERDKNGRIKGLPWATFYISDQNECLLYVYHNTFAGSVGVTLGRPITRNSRNWWFVNNICSNDLATMNVWGGHGKDYHFHYNYIGNSSGKEWYEGYTGNVQSFKLLWEPGTPGLFSDFRIDRDWPCRGKGIDLSKPWELDGVKNPALAGLEPGYFTGPAPDLGALQYGEEMPQVGPRWSFDRR